MLLSIVLFNSVFGYDDVNRMLKETNIVLQEINGENGLLNRYLGRFDESKQSDIKGELLHALTGDDTEEKWLDNPIDSTQDMSTFLGKAAQRFAAMKDVVDNWNKTPQESMSLQAQLVAKKAELKKEAAKISDAFSEIQKIDDKIKKLLGVDTDQRNYSLLEAVHKLISTNPDFSRALVLTMSVLTVSDLLDFLVKDVYREIHQGSTENEEKVGALTNLLEEKWKAQQKITIDDFTRLTDNVDIQRLVGEIRELEEKVRKEQARALDHTNLQKHPEHAVSGDDTSEQEGDTTAEQEEIAINNGGKTFEDSVIPSFG